MGRRVCVLCGVGVSVLLAFAFAGAAVAQDDARGFEIPEGLPDLRPPIVVTTCGQSPGALMVDVICDMIGLSCDQADVLTAEELADGCSEDLCYGVLFVTTGTSLKGMGAAGVDIDYEIVRCTALIEAAKELGMVIIVGQIEGPSRRVDKYDDQSIQAMSPLADLLITRADVNEDSYFTDLAEEYGIPQIFIEDAIDLEILLPILFPPDPEADE
jgi:hypothetical protein